MAKMTLEKLQAIKIKLAKRLADREDSLNKAQTTGIKQILVCASTGCLSSNSRQIMANFNKLIEEKNLKGKVEVSQTGCHGLCAQGPVVLIYPEGIFYAHVKPEDCTKIIEQHIINNQPVKELIFKNQLDANGNILPLNKTGFYKNQVKIALRHAGVIDPENIEEYIAADGYFALHKVLTQMTPDEVIKEVSDAQLRGRGGGGFPTGRK